MTSNKFDPVNGVQNENYLFSNGGYAATARLSLQYYLFGQQVGYQVSPSIPLDQENLKIADVGTGTGIWLVNLSKKVPASTTLHGFDLKTDLLPRSEWLPTNVSFHSLDVFKPVPEQHAEKYDVVHIRFFAPVVKNGDPTPVLKAAVKLLKPGGILQWDERDMNMTVIGGSANEHAMKDLVEITNKLGRDIGSDFEWIHALDQSFKDAGLENVELKRYPVPKEIFGYHQDLIFQTVEEGSYGMDRLGYVATAKKMSEAVRDAYEEHRVYGTAVNSDLVICVGRKA